MLKLLGIAPEEAEEYTFRSVVLKERRLEPDTEGIPVSEAYGRKAFIEFQGYSDKFIRYRLAAKIIKCNGTVPKEKFHTYLGNTVSSTIPIALEQLYGNNMIKKNQKIMLVAFGVGYSWAVTILYT